MMGMLAAEPITVRASILWALLCNLPGTSSEQIGIRSDIKEQGVYEGGAGRGGGGVTVSERHETVEKSTRLVLV